MPGLYFHIPFCEQKCIYCDFYSLAPSGGKASQDDLIGGFVTALESEVRIVGAGKQYDGLFDTIFFGGGTPSLLSKDAVASIINWTRSFFRVDPAAEITLETNPGTVDPAKLEAFRESGINRLSIGIQSFHEDELRFLTRIHDGRQARECVKNARSAGFDNISIDLIFSLPGQAQERWASNLEQALELAPNHISCYSLIVEPNTPLKRLVESKQVVPLNGEDDARMYEMTIDFLTRHGYEQYEVSNFALPGFRSRHNANYWNHGEYLGFGPSAHSFWDARRWWNIANLSEYHHRIARGALPIAGEERLTSSQMVEEMVFLGLRGEGVKLPSVLGAIPREKRSECRAAFERLVREGFARAEGEVVRLTSKGYPLCDEICTSLAL